MGIRTVSYSLPEFCMVSRTEPNVGAVSVRCIHGRTLMGGRDVSGGVGGVGGGGRWGGEKSAATQQARSQSKGVTRWRPSAFGQYSKPVYFNSHLFCYCSEFGHGISMDTKCLAMIHRLEGRCYLAH